jgi:hypothetical protein
VWPGDFVLQRVKSKTKVTDHTILSNRLDRRVPQGLLKVSLKGIRFPNRLEAGSPGRQKAGLTLEQKIKSLP